MMTQKEFEGFALIMHTFRHSFKSKRQFTMFLECMMATCFASNPRFKRDKFIEAVYSVEYWQDSPEQQDLEI